MFFTSSLPVDMLLLLILATLGLHVLWQKRKGRWFILDPLNAFMAAVLVCYIFQPIAYFSTLVFQYGIDKVTETVFWCWFGVLFVIIGYELPWGIRWARKIPEMPAVLQPSKLVRFAWVFIALGLFAYVVFIISAGGLSQWLSVGRGATNWEAISGYVAVLETALPVGVTLLLFRVEIAGCSTTTRAMAWSLGILQWLWFVYLGSRGRTIIFLLSLLGAYYLPRRKNPSTTFAVVGVVGLFLLTSFQAAYRGQFTNLSLHLDNLTWSDVKQRILPTKLGGQAGARENHSLGDLEFNCVCAVVDLVPNSVNYNYGATLLELVTRPIPRGLWSNKSYPLLETQTPVMYQRHLSEYWIVIGSHRFLSGPAFTFVGYWYHAGGPIGLIVAGLLTGAFFRAIRTVFDRHPGNQGDLILYMTLIPIGFSEGAATPTAWIFTLPFVLIPLVIFLRHSGQGAAVEPSHSNGFTPEGSAAIAVN